MRFLGFIVVFSLVLGSGFLFVGWRLIRPMRLEPSRERALWLGVGSLIALPLISFLPRVLGAEGGSWDFLAWPGYIGLGLFFLLFILVVTVDLARLPAKAADLVRAVQRAPSERAFLPEGAGREGTTPEGEPSLAAPAALEPSVLESASRRVFLARAVGASTLGATGVLGTVGVFEAVGGPTVVEVEVPIRGLAPALEGFRIAQITDLHIGPTIREDYVGTVVDQVNALEADVVAITGDLVDGSVPHLRRAAHPLGSLHGRHGVFFVTGNHEYYSGVDAWTEEVDRLGMRVLLNQHRVIEVGGAPLALGGVTDTTAGRFKEEHHSDAARAFAGVPAGAPRILLAHQPKSIDDAAAAHVDLQISGHTHGGQIFPFNVFVALAQPYVEGLHLHGDTHIYVSRGTGYWGPPMRLAAPAEISVLRLVRA